MGKRDRLTPNFWPFHCPISVFHSPSYYLADGQVFIYLLKYPEVENRVPRLPPRGLCNVLGILLGCMQHELCLNHPCEVLYHDKDASVPSLGGQQLSNGVGALSLS